jgi:predicted MFS family arabinose efflux permease
MSTAFSLTLAYLAETTGPAETAGALAAYITGNVASNLVGRLISAAVADHLGLASNFYFFAALNLTGAALVFFSLKRGTQMPASVAALSNFAALGQHLRNRALLACFGIGFCILFAFIGTFTYVNFLLSRPPFAISAMQLGYVYFVFLPSLLTTPLAGLMAKRIGARPAFWSALAVAGIGLPLLLASDLPLVLCGLALVAAGTFFAQAMATGFVGRAATLGGGSAGGGDRGSAGGIYLASYFFGGLVGSAVLGQVFDHLGWPACVTGVGIALTVAASLALRLDFARPTGSTRSK